MLHSGHEANYQVEPRAREATRGGGGPTFLPSLLQDQCPLSTPSSLAYIGEVIREKKMHVLSYMSGAK